MGRIASCNFTLFAWHTYIQLETGPVKLCNQFAVGYFRAAAGRLVSIAESDAFKLYDLLWSAICPVIDKSTGLTCAYNRRICWNSGVRTRIHTHTHTHSMTYIYIRRKSRKRFSLSSETGYNRISQRAKNVCENERIQRAIHLLVNK